MARLVSSPIQKAVDFGPMHRQQQPCRSLSPGSSDAYLWGLCLSLVFLFFEPFVLLLLLLLLLLASDARLCWLPTFSGLLANNCFPFTMDDLSLAQSNPCPVFRWRIEDDDDDECGGKDDDVIVTFIGCSGDTFYVIDAVANGAPLSRLPLHTGRVCTGKSPEGEL